MRRWWMCTTVLLLVVLTDGAWSGMKNDAGVGLVFGNPSGIAWSVSTGEENALSGAVGFSVYSRFQAHVDYLWYAWPFTNQDVGLYYGVGGAVGFGEPYPDDRPRYSVFAPNEDAPGFGVRVPVGLAYFVPESPVELFLEAAPLLVLVPAAGAGFDGGIGARIHF